MVYQKKKKKNDGIYDAYLYHHGIKGQSWGKRNGPPYPLNPETDYSKKERKAQKKAYRDLKKTYKKSYDPARPASTSKEFDEKAEKYASELISKEEINNIISLREKMDNTWKNTRDYFDSDQYKKDSKRAYNDTYKWFEENDKPYLDKIIKLNNGSKEKLDAYHDFRKTLEGYEDEYWQIGEEKWKKTPEGKEAAKKEKEWEKAFHEYCNACDKATSNILGEYGNKKVSMFDDTTINDVMRWSLRYENLKIK